MCLLLLLFPLNLHRVITTNITIFISIFISIANIINNMVIVRVMDIGTIVIIFVMAITNMVFSFRHRHSLFLFHHHCDSGLISLSLPLSFSLFHLRLFPFFLSLLFLLLQFQLIRQVLHSFLLLKDGSSHFAQSDATTNTAPTAGVEKRGSKELLGGGGGGNEGVRVVVNSGGGGCFIHGFINCWSRWVSTSRASSSTPRRRGQWKRVTRGGGVNDCGGGGGVRVVACRGGCSVGVNMVRLLLLLLPLLIVATMKTSFESAEISLHLLLLLIEPLDMGLRFSLEAGPVEVKEAGLGGT